MSGVYVGTFAPLTLEAAVRLKVRFVAGFSDDAHGFSYFLTVQPEVFNTGSGTKQSTDTESKLTQVSPRGSVTITT